MLILVGLAGPAAAMTPGPDVIIQCPEPDRLGKLSSWVSGNTWGGRYWSDGYQSFPMLPSSPGITRCGKDGKFFWVNDAKRVGQVDSFWQRDDRSKIPPAWRNAVSLHELSAAEYLDALASGMARNRKEERYLRLHAWWAVNDQVRSHHDDANHEAPNPFAPPSAARTNLEQLVTLLSADKPAERLLKAEALRELGQFEAARQVLQAPFSDAHANKMALWLRTLLDARDVLVRERVQAPKIKRPPPRSAPRDPNADRHRPSPQPAADVVAPLHKAARRAHNVNRLRHLLETGATLERKDPVGRTALHWSAYLNRLENARFLLSRGANVMAVDRDGRTPLHLAGSLDMAQLLVAHGASVRAKDAGGDLPIHQAKNRRMASFYVAQGSPIEERGRSGDHPIHRAAQRGRRDVIGFLLEQGAQLEAVNNMGETPLFSAVHRNDPQTVLYLLQQGADFQWRNREGESPLHVAAHLRKPRAGRTLIDHGVPVNAVDKRGRTPLHWAAFLGDQVLVESLLDSGAWPDHRDRYGNSPLDLAKQKHIRYQNYDEIIQRLERLEGNQKSEVR